MLFHTHSVVLQTFSNFVFLHNNYGFLLSCQKNHWQYNKEKYLCWVGRYWPTLVIKLFYKYQWKEVIKIQSYVAEYYLLCYYFEDSCHQKIYIPSENQCKWNLSNKSVFFFFNVSPFQSLLFLHNILSVWPSQSNTREENNTKQKSAFWSN